MHDLNFCLLFRLLFFISCHNNWVLNWHIVPRGQVCQNILFWETDTMSKIVWSKTSSCVVIEKYCDSHNQRSAPHFLPSFFPLCSWQSLLPSQVTWHQPLAPQGIVGDLVMLHPTSVLLNHNLHINNISQIVHIQMKTCLFKHSVWSVEWLILA